MFGSDNNRPYRKANAPVVTTSSKDSKRKKTGLFGFSQSGYRTAPYKKSEPSAEQVIICEPMEGIACQPMEAVVCQPVEGVGCHPVTMVKEE